MHENRSGGLLFFFLTPQTGETRTVSHINFSTWPDHGVPKVGYLLNPFGINAPVKVNPPPQPGKRRGLGQKNSKK